MSESWEISKLGDIYTIKNNRQNKYLSLTSNNELVFENEATLEQTWQHWTFEKNEKNQYRIKNTGQDKYLLFDDGYIFAYIKEEDIITNDQLWELENFTSELNKNVIIKNIEYNHNLSSYDTMRTYSSQIKIEKNEAETYSNVWVPLIYCALDDILVIFPYGFIEDFNNLCDEFQKSTKSFHVLPFNNFDDYKNYMNSRLKKDYGITKREEICKKTIHHHNKGEYEDCKLYEDSEYHLQDKYQNDIFNFVDDSQKPVTIFVTEFVQKIAYVKYLDQNIFYYEINLKYFKIKNIKTTQTLTNCFFSSLFRSLIDNGGYIKFKKCLEITVEEPTEYDFNQINYTTNEKEFISNIRSILEINNIKNVDKLYLTDEQIVSIISIFKNLCDIEINIIKFKDYQKSNIRFDNNQLYFIKIGSEHYQYIIPAEENNYRKLDGKRKSKRKSKRNSKRNSKRKSKRNSKRKSKRKSVRKSVRKL